jgi:hypothetical protein
MLPEFAPGCKMRRAKGMSMGHFKSADHFPKLRPWKWGVMKPYNGFTHEERVRGGQLIHWFIDNSWLAKPSRCSISGSTERVQYHCEDYYSPWQPYAINQQIHLALHRRFRQPDDWACIRDRYSVTGSEWFCALPMQPVDLAGALRAQHGNGIADIFSRAPVPQGREPRRVFRRLFRLSHAAMAGSSSMA